MFEPRMGLKVRTHLVDPTDVQRDVLVARHSGIWLAREEEGSTQPRADLRTLSTLVQTEFMSRCSTEERHDEHHLPNVNGQPPG